MRPGLHVFKVLIFAESVGVVTSGYVTKMAVTPCDAQLPKLFLLYANVTTVSQSAR